MIRLRLSGLRTEMRGRMHAQVGHPGRRRSDRNCSRASGEIEDLRRQHPVSKGRKVISFRVLGKCFREVEKTHQPIGAHE